MLRHLRCTCGGPPPGGDAGDAAVIIGTVQTRAPPAASLLRKLRLDSLRAARDSGSILSALLGPDGCWLFP